MINRTRLLRALAANVALFLSATAVAGDDVVVTISRDFIEQAVEGAVRLDPNPALDGLAWNAIVTRTSRTELHVRVNGAASGVVLAWLDLDVRFDCGAQGAGAANACNAQSHIRIAIANVAAATVAGPVAGADVVQIEAALNSAAAGINRELTCRLNDGLAWTDRPAICPIFNVTNAVNVTATLDLVAGCVTGSSRTEPCQAGFTGTGTTFVCTNGRWAPGQRHCIYLQSSGSGQPN